MNAPLDVVRRPSVCPHDCPSVCALDVEVIGGARIGRIHGAAGPALHVGRRLRQGRALRRAHPSPGSADPAAAPGRPEGLRSVPADRLGRGARRRRGEIPRGRAPLRRRKRLAVFLRGHDGPRDARRDRTPDARQALFALLRHDLRRHRLAGLSSPAPDACRRRSARNGQVRLHRHLGHERGRDPGQRDDPRDARAQGARREDRRHRHLRHRDDAAGGPGAASEARHGRRARLRRHARSVPRRLRRPRLYRALHRRARRAGGPSRSRAIPFGRARSPASSVDEIEAFAALVGRTKRTFFRLGYGFSRQRNGAANMHAALCIPAVTGAWAHEGGGALPSNSGVFKLDKTLIEGLDVRDDRVRRLDQSRVGAVLTGEREALKGGGPVKAMLIQNTNPLAVAPDSGEGAATVSPATICSSACTSSSSPTPRATPTSCCRRRCSSNTTTSTPAAGTSICSSAPKTIEPPEGCRSNHELISRSPSARRASPRLRHDPARDHRLDACARRATATLADSKRRAGSTASRRSRRRIFSTASRYPGRQVPLPRRLGRDALRQRRPARAVARHADPARPLGGQRGGRRGAIPSSSRLRRRAIFSIPASPRRRLRARASGGRTR